MRPETFKQVYRSNKRVETEAIIISLHTANQAANGDKNSIEQYMKELDVWGTKVEDTKDKIHKYQRMLEKR